MVNFDYLFNKEYHIEAVKKDRHSKKRLGFQFLSDAVVLPYKVKEDGSGGG